MGIKSGRLSGLKLGYSQIANPVYMHAKGTMTFSEMTRHISKNIIINLVRSIYPESYIDRRGRLLGNILAVSDFIKKNLAPENAERIRR